VSRLPQGDEKDEMEVKNDKVPQFPGLEIDLSLVFASVQS
jgi:hypothetical protein